MDMGKNYFLVYQKEITQMNERIRQLALEADKDVGENVSFEFCERFAQLIVQECILTIQMGITRDGHNTEKYLRSMEHIMQIKKHFGTK
jgi:hypothetical protein